MIGKKRVGVGILTRNRPDYFKRCMYSVYENGDYVDDVIIVNDGEGIYDTKCPRYYTEIKNHKINLGISKSKNEIILHLLLRGCDYIFIVEDDILIKSPLCFCNYIKHYEKTGIHHFCCGSFLPSRGESIKTFKYSKYEDISIDIYTNCAGSFCFYTRECLLNVGMFDEKYWNALEHVDLTYRLAEAKYTTPFGFFADISNSKELIESIGGEFNDSIVNKENNKKVAEAFNYFKQKFGKGFPEIYENNINTCINYINEQYTNIRITN